MSFFFTFPSEVWVEDMKHQITDLNIKLVTLVEGNPKAPFSIATTPRCRGERYSFPWIGPLCP